MSEAKAYIGGPFELDFQYFVSSPRQEIEEYFGLGPGDVPLNTGRAAFRAILRTLDLTGRTILVPDFLCGEILIPLLKSESVDYVYYPVGKDLSVSAESLREAMNDTVSAILLINYFGLCDHSEVASKIRSWDIPITIILDNAQALYDSRAGGQNHNWADFVFVSFRKFLSVPDGAFVRGCKPVRIEDLRTGSDAGNDYLVGAALRHAFLSGRIEAKREAATEAAYLQYFRTAESRNDAEPAAMTRFSRELIRRLPLEIFAVRRRENYAYLAAALDERPSVTVLWPQLPPQVIPMALPVIVEKGKRDTLRNFLMERNIYCPIHWPLIPELRHNAPRNRAFLADNIMSLPVDQRYDPPQLTRLVKAVKDFESAA